MIRKIRNKDIVELTIQLLYTPNMFCCSDLTTRYIQ